MLRPGRPCEDGRDCRDCACACDVDCRKQGGNCQRNQHCPPGHALGFFCCFLSARTARGQTAGGQTGSCLSADSLPGQLADSSQTARYCTTRTPPLRSHHCAYAGTSLFRIQLFALGRKWANGVLCFGVPGWVDGPRRHVLWTLHLRNPMQFFVTPLHIMQRHTAARPQWRGRRPFHRGRSQINAFSSWHSCHCRGLDTR